MEQLERHPMLLYGRFMWATSGCWGGDAMQPGRTRDKYGVSHAQDFWERCRRRLRAMPDSAFARVGPYSRAAMLRQTMFLFASGPMDVRSRMLAAAIASCPWAKDAESQGARGFSTVGLGRLR